jgi:hypothetical protein
MATLANIFNHFTGTGTAVATATGEMARERSEAHRLRSLPNEDVYFFVKRVDNSRVVRQADPRARARDWKLVGVAGFAACAVIALLLPSAWGLMAGYQISSLQQENQRLVTERARLELEEARLVSPERLQVLATMQEFVDPTSASTVYLPKTDDSLALNRR